MESYQILIKRDYMIQGKWTMMGIKALVWEV